jgi:hypothetical protein
MIYIVHNNVAVKSPSNLGGERAVDSQSADIVAADS